MYKIWKLWKQFSFWREFERYSLIIEKTNPQSKTGTFMKLTKNLVIIASILWTRDWILKIYEGTFVLTRPLSSPVRMHSHLVGPSLLLNLKKITECLLEKNIGPQEQLSMNQFGQYYGCCIPFDKTILTLLKTSSRNYSTSVNHRIAPRSNASLTEISMASLTL